MLRRTLTGVLLLLLPAGCGSGDGRAALAFVTNGTSDFWAFTRRGCERADEELPGVRVHFRLPGDATAAEQRRIVDDLVAMGVKGIAISPIDPVNQKPMLDDLAARICVITCDSDIPGSRRLCYLGTDNVAAGRQAGGLIRECLPRGGKAMLFVGKRDTQNAKERIQGIREAIAGAGVEIVDVRTDENDKARAKANAADALVAHPDLGCLVGLWNYNGPAILAAVADAGRLGRAGIVCFDEDEETLMGVQDGHILGTVVQQPWEFGYRSIRLLARIVDGDRSEIPAGGLLIVPTRVIRRDQAAAFLAEMKALLGR